MKIRSQLAVVMSRLVLCIAAAVGVLTVCGVFAGKPDFAPLRYYAVFANAVCAMFCFVGVLFGLFSNREFLPRLRGAVVLLLFVSVILDAASLSGSRGTALSYVLLHYVTPFLALLDWLLFGAKGCYRWSSPVLWMILPNVYFLYAVLRAKLITGAGYLYAFLNPQAGGMKQVILTVLLLNVFSLALGYLFVSLDQLFVKRKKRRKKSKR